MPKRWLPLVGVVGLALGWGVVAQTAMAEPPAWVNGAAALARLGSSVDAVAARHGLSTAQLRSNLLHDPSLFVDADDQLLYVDRPAPEQARATDAELGPTSTAVDPTTALTLHSRPGSKRVIYLDFDGQMIDGAGWTGATGGPCFADPYDSDGKPAFSNEELIAIAGVWARVAEDFATMDVDVTTADPGVEAIRRSSSFDSQYGTRVLVTSSRTTCPNGTTLYQSVCAGGCGGVAYVGVFDQTSNHDDYQPALVFQNGVGPAQKLVAEAASHEAGHTGGLSHDGTAQSAYYGGHASWAPIMGVGYYRPITQWSRGEYEGANQTQDDFAVMQSNGLQPIADEYPDRSPAALGLGATRTGIISSRADVDAFSISLKSTTTVTITASPTTASPDLDIGLTLSGRKDNVITSADPPSGFSSEDVATGMDASITITLSPGTYTARVDGVGFGTASQTGYSDYASVGAYSITVTTGG